MGVVGAVFWKEFRGFINSPLAYIFLILFLLYLGATFFFGGLVAGGFTGIQVKEASLEAFFASLPYAFVIIVPALAMKLWPDELKLGTVELLMSYPVKPRHVVVGKFLAGLALIATALACTLVTPFTVASYGRLDWGPVQGSYLASLLLGGAFLSVGLFAGALCREQVTAFILTLLICGALVLVGKTEYLMTTAEGFSVWANRIAFNTRFESMAKGVIDLRDVIYFTTFIVAFLTLNTTVLEARKAK
ncbi:MAG TPA: ABC transporter permease [Planctomycetota bacterium]|nr:ABC transporter permease [Planctomycetota bacterium]